MPQENIISITNTKHTSNVRMQLSEISAAPAVLSEPVAKNTAPAIVLAAKYIMQKSESDPVIIVVPSDHLIKDNDKFLSTVKKGEKLANEGYIVTFGIKPDYPETGYGYIQSSDIMLGEFTKVKTFTEKPDLELAKVFMESGEFFWNSGLFVWNVNTILEAFSKFLPDISLRFDLGKEKFNTAEERDFIAENFPYCLNISIDYGIMEKADNVYMLCVDFGWADLGTWGSLFDLAKKDEQNNALLKSEAIMYESNGNIVALDNPKRLTVIQGINDCIVAESGNVLLICKKEDEQRIKQFVADAQMKYGKEFN